MFQLLLKKIALALHKKNIPYMVIGGQAVLLYGEPRLTKDIDITLGTGVRDVHKIKKVAESLGLKPLVTNIEKFVKETMVFPVMNEKNGIRVDFIFSFSPYERQAINRAVSIKIAGTQVKFASLEDVVIHKMAAGRARDVEDVKTILLKNPGYDKDYIYKWLAQFDGALDTNYREKFRSLIKEIKSDMNEKG
ncbi:MAG: nucleotidyl transferase AbiEii/AbiGii toxin family protein [Candidatus Aminicenantes bacterium]